MNIFNEENGFQEPHLLRLEKNDELKFEQINSNLSYRYIIDDFYNDYNLTSKTNIHNDEVLGEIIPIGFNKTFGVNYYNIGMSMIKTSDKGYLILGGSKSNESGDLDILLIKTNKNGYIEWNQTYGGENDEIGRSVLETSKNGFVLTGGIKNRTSGNSDIWIIKTDYNGKIIWNRTIGSKGFEDSYQIQQTYDKGFVIIGDKSNNENYTYNILVIKFNQTGIVEWEKTYDFSFLDSGQSIIVTDTNDIFLLGKTKGSQILVLKINELGELIWNKTFGEINIDHGVDFESTDDGGVFVIGWTKNPSINKSQILMIKINKDGFQEKKIILKSSDDNLGIYGKQISINSYVLVGYTIIENTTNADLIILRTNQSGNILWKKEYGGVALDRGKLFLCDENGSFTVLGNTESFGGNDLDIWLLNFDHFGNLNPNGSYESKNMLNKNVDSILSFNVSSSIPNGTNIFIQFSNDRINWYNSNNIFNEWNRIENNNFSIDLQSINVKNTDFYYRIRFTSQNNNAASIDKIKIDFLQIIDQDNDNIPDNKDTDDDNDSYLDSWEDYLNTDPFDKNHTPLDTDNDFLPNGDINNSKSWMDNDDDNDNIPDNWEIKYGLNPLNSNDSDLDDDGDGFTNKEEFDLGTDPTDPEDPPKINNENGSRFNFIIILIIIIIIILFITGFLKNYKFEKK